MNLNWLYNISAIHNGVISIVLCVVVVVATSVRYFYKLLYCVQRSLTMIPVEFGGMTDHRKSLPVAEIYVVSCES